MSARTSTRIGASACFLALGFAACLIQSIGFLDKCCQFVLELVSDAFGNHLVGRMLLFAISPCVGVVVVVIVVDSHGVVRAFHFDNVVVPPRVACAGNQCCAIFALFLVDRLRDAVDKS